MVSQDEFHAIHHVMVGHAFAIHNQYGRMLDENIYKNELAYRCAQGGLGAEREVLIRVRHGSFVKEYFIDLLLAGSTVAEAKCAATIAPAHRAQALNYVLLAGTHHGSLVNFRPLKVQSEFVSTTLTPDDRRRFSVATHNWPDDTEHQKLRETVVSLCADVGMGLEVALYREAVATLMGVLPQSVPIMAGSRQLGEHSMHLLRDGVGLAVTAATRFADTRKHLQRLLNHTTLDAIAWVNLPLNSVRFELLKKAE
ncbi:MAG: GxxExxY protein [Verrucomicrobiaceae bacterium]|nr:GxxExxY protein [Verrucomicrobiaceae bacterium]